MVERTEEATKAGHERFIAEYLVDGNSSAAAARAGFGTRQGAALLKKLRGEIEQRQTAAKRKASDKPDVSALIHDAEAAYEIAKASGNATGMTGAITLKAKLLGLLDPEPEPATGPVDQAAAARAVLEFLQEAAQTTGLELKISFTQPPEATVDPMQALAAPASDPLRTDLPPPAATPSTAATNVVPLHERRELLVGESESFSNGSSIHRVLISGSDERKYLILGHDSVEHGYRREYQAAKDLAESLPGFKSEFRGGQT